MTQTTVTPSGQRPRPSAPRQTTNSTIRPFRPSASDGELADLRRRVEATRFPERETVNDQSQGVPLATIQKLARYWATDYDWRKCEARLNALPQFITEIDGLDIHFVHVRSKHKNALPLIVTHGWPGSIVEQLKIVEPLTNPENPADAFDLVIPSMPGYGYSGKPTKRGWGPRRIARAWLELMKRLGYQRFVAQGGDWGAIVTEMMALQGAPELIGIHVNMPGAFPAEIDKAVQAGSPLPANLSDEEKVACEQLSFFYKHVYYAYLQADRPQTLTALADSPVGMAAFLLDHDAKSLAMIARSFDGQKEGLSRDDVLDNCTLFWLTNTAISAARLYGENTDPFFTAKGITIPVAVSIFPDELYTMPKSWAERAFPKLIHYNRLDKGGHFAAWEQPELFVNELRNGFRTLR